MSLGLLSKLSDPIHQMVLSWEDWYMANNSMGGPEQWDPASNPTHMIRSEVSDVYKAMAKIRHLEQKLGASPAGQSSADLNMLNSLKRELGIPVEFADGNAALDASQNVNAATVAAFN